MLEKEETEQLFREQAERMHRLATTMLHDEEEARDAVSEIFERLTNGAIRLPAEKPESAQGTDRTPSDDGIPQSDTCRIGRAAAHGDDGIRRRDDDPSDVARLPDAIRRRTVLSSYLRTTRHQSGGCLQTPGTRIAIAQTTI